MHVNCIGTSFPLHTKAMPRAKLIALVIPRHLPDTNVVNSEPTFPEKGTRFSHSHRPNELDRELRHAVTPPATET